MRITNKFLEWEDYKLISFQCIKKEFDYLYEKVLKKSPHHYGEKFSYKTKIHWERDWEYPWAIVNSEVKSGEKVLDCGCGGSPLLFFLSQYNCEAYGIDMQIVQPHISVIKYYKNLLIEIKKFIFLNILNKSHRKDTIKDHNRYLYKIRLKEAKNAIILYNKFCIMIKNLIKHDKNNLRYNNRDPKELGFNIRFFEEKIDNMHFKDNYFDKVFCISVIEHLTKETANKGIKEMVRVLKKGGLLLITLDNDGEHVNPELIGKYEELIKISGLELYGASNFEKPLPENVPGYNNVVGFILKKK